MSAILAFAGWTVIPNYASNFIHNGLIRVLPLSPPGTAKYARDRRIIYVLVVSSYLLYSLIQAYRDLDPNYFEMLGVPIDVEEKKLRTYFRKLSAIHHPDKGGDEETFRSLRLAYDTLSERRFAYERFGPQVINWERTKTRLEDMMYGFQASVPFYVSSFLFIFVLGWFQGATYGAHWRALSFLTLACINFVIATGPESLPVFQYILPGKVQFEQIKFLQSVSITILIAISQVGPALFPPDLDPNSQESMMELAALAKLLNYDVTQTMQVTHLPFRRGNTITNGLYEKTAEWMVNARVDMDPEVKEARQNYATRSA